MHLGSFFFSFPIILTEVSYENTDLSQGNQRKESWLWTLLQLAGRGEYLFLQWLSAQGRWDVHIGPRPRRDSQSPSSHFRLKGFVICFEIRKVISSYNSICYWDFPEFYIFWTNVNPWWELPLSNPNLCARFGISATCTTTISKRSTLTSFKHPAHHISQSYFIWHVTPLG